MAKGPDFTGFGGYGPWPDNDVPVQEAEPSPHYHDGWANRMPMGGHYEGPADYWIDCMVYPERPRGRTDDEVNMQDLKARRMTIGVGNATGWKNGPTED